LWNQTLVRSNGWYGSFAASFSGITWTNIVQRGKSPFAMLSKRSRWWLSRSLPTSASASASVRFLMPCWQRRWNLTQKRSFLGLMKLNVWLPKPCMWR